MENPKVSRLRVMILILVSYLLGVVALTVFDQIPSEEPAATPSAIQVASEP